MGKAGKAGKATLGTFADKRTEPGPGQFLVRTDHPASKGMKRQGRPYFQIVTDKGLQSLADKGYEPVVVRSGGEVPARAKKTRGKKKAPAAPKRPPTTKSMFPPPAASAGGQASLFGGAVMGDSTVVMGAGKKKKKKAGSAGSAGRFATPADPVPPGKVMVRTLHPLTRKGKKDFYMIVDPDTVRDLRREGLKPTVVSGYPSAGALMGQAEVRAYSPWMVLAGAATGHVAWGTGATLMEALPAPDGTLSKLVPWIEVGTGTLNILLAYLMRSNSFAFGLAGSGVQLIPRGIAVFLLRVIANRRMDQGAMTPGTRGKAGQFTPEEEARIRQAEQELLGKLKQQQGRVGKQPAAAGRRNGAGARAGAVPQVSMSDLQPGFMGDRKALWS
jgi:hypothetical protein